MSPPTTNPSEASLPPSKSQRKRDAHAQQALGARLVGLSPRQLQHLELADALHTAITEARTLRSHTARKRQLQFIGKLLRQMDVLAIENALEVLANGDLQRRRRAEQQVFNLLDDPQAFNKLCQAHPDFDRQHLRQQLRRIEHEGRQGPALTALIQQLLEL